MANVMNFLNSPDGLYWLFWSVFVPMHVAALALTTAAVARKAVRS